MDGTKGEGPVEVGEKKGKLCVGAAVPVQKHVWLKVHCAMFHTTIFAVPLPLSACCKEPPFSGSVPGAAAHGPSRFLYINSRRAVGSLTCGWWLHNLNVCIPTAGVMKKYFVSIPRVFLFLQQPHLTLKNSSSIRCP